MAVRFFPYDYRPCQQAMVTFIRDGVMLGRRVVVESGTGTGKTAVSLAGTLSAVHGTGCKVVYLTRTKSQHRQVAVECRAISRNIPVVSVAMQGRNVSTCPVMTEDPDLRDGDPEELSRLCAELKKGNGSAGGCRYFREITETTVNSCLSFIKGEVPDPEGFRDFCAALGVCPYEMSKQLLKYADVVSASYPFMFDPVIRSRFLSWMGVSEKEVVIVVDEAHNLPGYLRESQTCRVTARALDLSLAEARKNGDPGIGNGLRVSDMVQAVRDIMDRAAEEFLKDEENAMIPPGHLQEELMSGFGMTSFRLRECLVGLSEAGLRISEAKKNRRKLPRSHVGTLARFLMQWMDCEDEGYVYLVSGGENPALEAYCLDPSPAAVPLRVCKSSVCMSGTLAPLKYFTRETGIGDADVEEFPSPFDPRNRRTVYVDDVSTKFDEINSEDGTFGRIADHIVSIVNAVNVNTAVFFPSYALMEKFVASGLEDRLGRRVFREDAAISNGELMDRVMHFRSTPGAVLFSICGGRVSEGLDFPGKEMELAVLVGIPYGRPSARQRALVQYCQARMGSGWEIAVKAPAIRKMRQSVGRLIRSENDRGIAVVLDRRAGSLEGLEAELTKDPVADVKDFFARSPQ